MQVCNAQSQAMQFCKVITISIILVCINTLATYMLRTEHKDMHGLESYRFKIASCT